MTDNYSDGSSNLQPIGVTTEQRNVIPMGETFVTRATGIDIDQQHITPIDVTVSDIYSDVCCDVQLFGVTTDQQNVIPIDVTGTDAACLDDAGQVDLECECKEYIIPSNMSSLELSLEQHSSDFDDTILSNVIVGKPVVTIDNLSMIDLKHSNDTVSSLDLNRSKVTSSEVKSKRCINNCDSLSSDVEVKLSRTDPNTSKNKRE